MLLRFGVANHLSLRGFQELSFAASSLKDPDQGLIACPPAPGGSVVPAAVVYGANASGKSNLMNAMRTMWEMVSFSHTRGSPEGGVSRQPFRLDTESAGEPTRFDLDFTIDGVRHHYGFEASDAAFESEWLYDFPNSRRRMLFEREDGAFRFGRALGGRNAVIADLTRPNSLYLSAAAQNGHERLSRVFEYFRAVRGARGISITGAAASAVLAGEEPDRRAIAFLEKIGAGVVGYRRRDSNGANPIAIELAHRGRDGTAVYLDPACESAGTRRLLVVLGHAFRALDDGAPLFIDELDASLHTRAAGAVLRLFRSPETNPKGAQLVATTHDTNLMGSPLLRRDQLWFTEKDDGGATRLYPLTDFRTRKGDNVARGYLQGRFGAVPFDDPVSALAAPR